jgi:hypothetical protein
MFLPRKIEHGEPPVRAGFAAERLSYSTLTPFQKATRPLISFAASFGSG